MLRYNFKINRYAEGPDLIVKEITNIIRYKCLICGYQHEYDETWTDEKKAEVQAEMDAHHAEHLNFENIL
jgi:hypothetical protein